MNLIVFFIIAVLTLTYLLSFWQNRRGKVVLQLFNQKIEMSLGLLMFGVFIDSAILSALLLWLL